MPGDQRTIGAGRWAEGHGRWIGAPRGAVNESAVNGLPVLVARVADGSAMLGCLPAEGEPEFAPFRLVASMRVTMAASAAASTVTIRTGRRSR